MDTLNVRMNTSVGILNPSFQPDQDQRQSNASAEPSYEDQKVKVDGIEDDTTHSINDVDDSCDAEASGTLAVIRKVTPDESYYGSARVLTGEAEGGDGSGSGDEFNVTVKGDIYKRYRIGKQAVLVIIWICLVSHKHGNLGYKLIS